MLYFLLAIQMPNYLCLCSWIKSSGKNHRQIPFVCFVQHCVKGQPVLPRSGEDSFTCTFSTRKLMLLTCCAWTNQETTSPSHFSFVTRNLYGRDSMYTFQITTLTNIIPKKKCSLLYTKYIFYKHLRNCRQYTVYKNKGSKRVFS